MSKILLFSGGPPYEDGHICKANDIDDLQVMRSTCNGYKIRSQA